MAYGVTLLVTVAHVSATHLPQWPAAASTDSRAASLSAKPSARALPPHLFSHLSLLFRNDVRAAFPAVARQTSDEEAKAFHPQTNKEWFDKMLGVLEKR